MTRAVAAERGEVMRYARAAFNLLLRGFRARDGFLALQTQDEYNAAATAAGEVRHQAGARGGSGASLG